MAKLMVIGSAAQVEILSDPEDEDLVLAKCASHVNEHSFNARPYSLPACTWEARHDTTDDAWADAEAHADGVR